MKTVIPVLCAVLFGSSVTLRAQLSQHRHPNAGDAMQTVASGIEIASVEPDKAFKKEMVARNRKYESFAAYEENGGYRIFFTERKSKKVYEIRGLPLAWRPFSDMVWLNNHTLTFDRWANPHHGTHYEIDARTRKLKRALIFSDEK